jgi:hypothetical protein
MPLTHGMYRTPTHVCWMNMLQRCNNPKSTSYRLYGAAGIKVCRRWRTFENFFSDMGSRPGLEYSIDRKNGKLGYWKSNCRWATRSEQARNRNNNHFIKLFGKWNYLIDVAHNHGILHSVLIDRLRRGMTPEEAIVYCNPKYRDCCAQGHLLSGDNLYITKRGHRACRTCQRDFNFDYRRRLGIATKESKRKLSDAQILEIYARRETDRGYRLAEEFEVGRSLVSAILNRKYYRLINLLKVSH